MVTADQAAHPPNVWLSARRFVLRRKVRLSDTMSRGCYSIVDVERAGLVIAVARKLLLSKDSPSGETRQFPYGPAFGYEPTFWCMRH